MKAQSFLDKSAVKKVGENVLPKTIFNFIT